jgi:hypothetical protein
MLFELQLQGADVSVSQSALAFNLVTVTELVSLRLCVYLDL